MQNLIEDWQGRIAAAAERKTPLRLRGGGSKDFYGGPAQGEPFDTSAYRGIVDYEPTELVLQARAGTPLAEVERALAERGQMLAFEPPHFGAAATLGGSIACGLSGPRRVAAGAARDFVLGVRILDGRGRDLSFGGKVMKNVAGYDVSRLMTGALGTLGVLLDISLKVLPRPERELTLRMRCGQDEAIRRLNAWAGKPYPLSASCHEEGALTVRLSGTDAGVAAVARALGGDALPQAESFWHDLREQRAAFFAGDEPLWRLSVKSTAPHLPLPGRQLVEWHGALRWLKTDAEPAVVRDVARKAGGHATLFRAAPGATPRFHPLPDGVMQLHRRLKQTFDPAGILNRGRLYPEL
jgi:glycolate oxidase FAD binding subunit